jgi:hypothetical protein
MATHATKEWEQARRDTQLEAIEAARAFLESDVASPLLSLTTRRRRTVALLVSGVHVSVRPELFIADTTNATAGAIKLYFSKSGALPDERARYAGAILHRFVESLSPDASADYGSCFVVDVFARRLHLAPRTYRRRRQDIDAACSEIAPRGAGRFTHVNANQPQAKSDRHTSHHRPFNNRVWMRFATDSGTE